MENSENAEPPGERLNEFPLISLFPKTEQNSWLWKNGYSKLAPQLLVKIHSHLEECQWLWDKFSPNNSLFNLWEFRLAWFQGFGYHPYFYTLYLREKPVAVLPLWFNKEEKRYEWFGGLWPEDNHFLLLMKSLSLFCLRLLLVLFFLMLL